MMRACLAGCLFVVGCAAPFAELKPSAPSSGVTLAYCGSAATSPQSVWKSLEPPTNVPPEVGGTLMPAQKEVRVCLRIVNGGDKPVRVSRSLVKLRCPQETESWSPDRDDEDVIALPHETRTVYVSFLYGPLIRGEEAKVTFEGAVRIGARALEVSPITLRKQ